jgi:hypothetical protein
MKRVKNLFDRVHLVDGNLNQRGKQQECQCRKIIPEDEHYKHVKFVALERRNAIMNDRIVGIVSPWALNAIIMKRLLPSTFLHDSTKVDWIKGL